MVDADPFLSEAVELTYMTAVVAPLGRDAAEIWPKKETPLAGRRASDAIASGANTSVAPDAADVDGR